MKRLLAIAVPGVLAAGAWTWRPQDPPTTRVLDCTTSGCHGDQLAHEHLHGPVAAGACLMCHEFDDPAAHSFVVKREGAALCDFCHIGKTDTAGLHVHAPVERGECLSCHDPHGSQTRRLLKTPTEGETCLQCHAPVVEGRSHLHTPVQQGDCLSCHRAHSSVLPDLLVQEGRALCVSCHSHLPSAPVEGAVAAPATFDGALASGAHASDTAKTVHAPALEECSVCHDHHGSNQAATLIESPRVLCSSCHEEVAQKIAGATVSHSVVVDDRACLNCHVSHQGDDSHLLRSDAISLCLTCHAKEIDRADGTKVAGMSSLANDHVSLHDPINRGCSECHDVHGGDHRALLTAPYTQDFYQAPEQEAYALCLSCHDAALMTAERSVEATAFRDGDRNLHYVHVTTPGARGRSCRVCHDTHAATSPRLVREDTSYGEWKIPIRFQATEQGGSCAGGCHRPLSYDRMKAPLSGQ